MTLVKLPARRILRVEGSERVEFLHGQLSSNVKALTDGAGQASLILSAQGRVEGIVAIYAVGDALEIVCNAVEIDAVQARLERFLIADDVELTLEPASATTLGLSGRDAPAQLAAVSGRHVTPGWQRADVEIAGERVRVHSRGEFRAPFYEISTSGNGDAVARALETRGAVPADDSALALLHVESGVARYGIDVDDTRTALEARLQWAIHFAKGCYVGQEVVERTVSRGRLNRRLALLASDRSLPVGVRVDDGAEVETVTSSVVSPEQGALALAYVGMERSNPGTDLVVAGTKTRVLAWPMREVYVGLRA